MKRVLKMIKNIVFDLGNVLLSFKPDEYLEKSFSNREIRRKFKENIFQSSEWVELDRGSITQKEAVISICSRCPELEGEVKKIFADLAEILMPIKESIELLKRLKEKGCYKLFVLSNFHIEAFNVVCKYEFFNYFDGIVISAKINYIKPEPDIYSFLLEEYDIRGKETLFIDDMKENLDCAENFEIKTILCKNPAQLEQELKDLDIL